MNNRIFVFASNMSGRHGAGSALEARLHHGAIYGKSEGLQGRSYAIPTKDAKLQVLSLEQIKKYVDQFVWYTREHPELEFDVVKIGCGLAGYRPEQIVLLFSDVPSNVHLPDGWLDTIMWSNQI